MKNYYILGLLVLLFTTACNKEKTDNPQPVIEGNWAINSVNIEASPFSINNEMVKEYAPCLENTKLSLKADKAVQLKTYHEENCKQEVNTEGSYKKNNNTLFLYLKSDKEIEIKATIVELSVSTLVLTSDFSPELISILTSNINSPPFNIKNAKITIKLKRE